MSGIQPGDTILSVGGVKVSSLDAVGQELQRCMAAGKSFVVRVRPNDAKDASVEEDVMIMF